MPCLIFLMLSFFTSAKVRDSFCLPKLFVHSLCTGKNTENGTRTGMKASGLKTDKKSRLITETALFVHLFSFLSALLPYHHFLSGLAIEGNDV